MDNILAKARIRYRSVEKEELKYAGGVYWLDIVIYICEKGKVHTEETVVPVQVLKYYRNKDKVEIKLLGGNNSCYCIPRTQVLVHEIID